MKKIIILFCFYFFCSATFASNIQHIVFFGDSLTDNGNLHHYLPFMPKTPPYFEGRFSNGPTWAEYVADTYNQAQITSHNYAVGGATAFPHNRTTDASTIPVSLPAEVGLYLGRTVDQDQTHTLFSIWVGSNDYLYDTSPDTETLTNEVVNHIIASMQNLANHGARYFMIINVPDLSETPYAKAHHISARLHTLSVTHNQKLTDTLAEFKNTHPDIQITTIDVASTLSHLLAHPDQFNQLFQLDLQNTTDACWTGDMIWTPQDFQNHVHDAVAQVFPYYPPLIQSLSDFIARSPDLAEAFNLGASYDAGLMPCSNADQYVFWDQMHITKPVHKMLGQVIVQTLNGSLLNEES